MFNIMVKTNSANTVSEVLVSVKETGLVKISVTCELNQKISPVLDPLWTSTAAINSYSPTLASLVFQLSFLFYAY